MATRVHETRKPDRVRFKFPDGVEFDVDLLKAMMRANRQLAFVIAETKHRQTQGGETTHENLLANNAERDLDIAHDELSLQLAIKRRDRGECSELHTLLGSFKVPKAKWATFKPQNITATLAKTYKLTKPTIRAILKNWKARYRSF